MKTDRLTPGQLLHFHRVRREAAEKGITELLDDTESVKWYSLNHDQKMLFIELIYNGVDASMVAAMFKNYADSMKQEELEIDA